MLRTTHFCNRIKYLVNTGLIQHFTVKTINEVSLSFLDINRSIQLKGVYLTEESGRHS